MKNDNVFEIGDLVEHIEFAYIGKITNIVESDIFYHNTGKKAGVGFIAHIDVIGKGLHGDSVPDKTTSFVDNIKKIYQVGIEEQMKNNEWSTQKIDGKFKPYDINQPNRYAFYALIGLLLCLAVVVSL